MNEGAQHRQLTILGMLLEQPMYGHQIKETIDVHLEGFSDLKRANLYYLLDRMADQGYLEARMETPDASEAVDVRGIERKVFYITDAGRQRFRALLRQVLGDVEPMNNPVDIAIFFLPHLPRAEALELLALRREQVAAQYEKVLANIAAHPGLSDLHDITNDHVTSLFELELAWLDRAQDRLQASRALRSA